MPHSVVPTRPLSTLRIAAAHWMRYVAAAFVALLLGLLSTGAQAQATPTLSLSPATGLYGNPITLTAKLSGGSNPTGSLTLTVGKHTETKTVNGNNDYEFLKPIFLASGIHTATVTYGSDDNSVNVSTAATSTITVTQAQTSLSLSISATAIKVGEDVTLTADVASDATGSITFQVNGISYTAAIVGGRAVTTVTQLAAGSYSIFASYGGDSNYTMIDIASTPPLSLEVTNTAPTAITLTPANGPTAGGTQVTIVGGNWGNSPAVSFGDVAAQVISSSSATSITVLTPAHAAGAVDVKVGSQSIASGFTYTATPTATLADPTKNAAVTALLGAQTQATQQFASAQLSNFSQRLESLHGDGWARSSFGLGLAPNSSNRAAANPWRDGDIIVGARHDLPSLGQGMRKVAARPAAAQQTQQPSATLPNPESNRQALSWWSAGAITIDQQRADSLRLTTSGISFGGDYRISQQLSAGLGIGYSRSHSQTNDASARTTGQAVVTMAYASYKPIDRMYIDLMAGYGVLHFDLSRQVDANNHTATSTRGGHQAFGSVTLGYEWRGNNWLLSPYGRVDIARASLDSYTESTGSTSDLTFLRQSVRNDAAYLGLRGEMHYEAPFGLLSPQAKIAYQHNLQGAGSASMRYNDPALQSPLYTYAPTAQDNAQWLFSLGGNLLLKNGLSLSLMYTHNAANSVSRMQSLYFSVGGRF